MGDGIGLNHRKCQALHCHNRTDDEVQHHRRPDASTQHDQRLQPLRSATASTPIPGWAPSETKGRTDTTSKAMNMPAAASRWPQLVAGQTTENKLTTSSASQRRLRLPLKHHHLTASVPEHATLCD